MNKIMITLCIAVTACGDSTTEQDVETVGGPSAFHELDGQLVAPVVADSGTRLLGASVDFRCNDPSTQVLFCVRTSDPLDTSIAYAECAGLRPCGRGVRHDDVDVQSTIVGPRRVADLVIVSNQLKDVFMRGSTYTTTAE